MEWQQEEIRHNNNQEPVKQITLQVSIVAFVLSEHIMDLFHYILCICFRCSTTERYCTGRTQKQKINLPNCPEHEHL